MEQERDIVLKDEEVVVAGQVKEDSTLKNRIQFDAIRSRRTIYTSSIILKR